MSGRALLRSVLSACQWQALEEVLNKQAQRPSGPAHVTAPQVPGLPAQRTHSFRQWVTPTWFGFVMTCIGRVTSIRSRANEVRCKQLRKLCAVLPAITRAPAPRSVSRPCAKDLIRPTSAPACLQVIACVDCCSMLQSKQCRVLLRSNSSISVSAYFAACVCTPVPVVLARCRQNSSDP